MSARSETPFVELPAALVEDVLGQTSAIGDRLIESFRHATEERLSFREQLVNAGLAMTETALGYPPLPTTCATDGSYAIERLLSVDLVAAAAVAVEGLTPPSEKRHWENPHYRTFVAPEPHHAETATVLRAVMLGNELSLATKAPHELVMIDGSFTLPVIYFNQALNQAPECLGLQCAQEFIEHAPSYLTAYKDLLLGERSDRQFAALPKYSTRREIGAELGWPEAYDDRGLLTLVLRAGELTKPRRLEQPDQEWHLYTSKLPPAKREEADKLVNDIVSGLGRVCIFYYKPQDWLPALRVEVPDAVATNTHRLATVIQGLKHQCATAAMFEPYPIHLADRMVKALARAVPAFRQVATQRVSERYEGEIGEVFFALHGYRSEVGS